MADTGPDGKGQPATPEPRKGYREVPILGVDEADADAELRMLYLTREHVIRQNAVLEADAMRMEHQQALMRELLARLVTKYGEDDGAGRKRLCLLVTDPEAQDDAETPPPQLVVDTTDEGTFLYVAGVQAVEDDGPKLVTLGGDSDAA